MKVGLDFGTTNSVVSFWNEEKKTVELFQYQEHVTTPTAIVYGFQQGGIAIGREATEAWSNDYELKLARFFKTELNNSDKSATAIKYCKDFIGYLLKNKNNGYCFEKNHGTIAEIVISVPELWQQDTANIGARNLLTAVDDILPVKQLVSEPLSALSYFCWKNPDVLTEEKKILVCDMGGGTNDISYCTVERKVDGKITIEVIAHDGSQGKSGVYDLHKILENFYKTHGKEDLIGSDDFKKDIWELDKQIQNPAICDIIEKNYPIYLKNPEDAVCAFRFTQKPLNTDLIYSAFPEIEKNIRDLLDRIKRSTADGLAFDHLLFIGGFSNYFLVRNTILNYFNLDSKNEKVKSLTKNDSVRAVAFGAALIAANQVEIRERYPHEISFEVFVGKENRKIEKVMIKAGALIHSDDIIWCNDKIFEIRNDRRIPLRGKIVKNNNKTDTIRFNKTFSFEVDSEETIQARVGVKVSRSNLLTLVIESTCKKISKEIQIGELLK